jgi:hypothetical protein
VSWGGGSFVSCALVGGVLAGDHTVIIRQNEMLLGVIDKNSIGSSEYGLVHCVYELFGAQRAGALLTAIGRLLTVYLQVGRWCCVCFALLVRVVVREGGGVAVCATACGVHSCCPPLCVLSLSLIHTPAPAGPLMWFNFFCLFRVLVPPQHVGISCGVEDLVLNPAADAARRALIESAVDRGIHAAAEFGGVTLPQGVDASKSQEVGPRDWHVDRGTCAWSIVYGSTKGFVSYGGFTHVGFPLRTSVSPPTLCPSSLQLPLSPLSPSPVTTFPSSSLSCSPFVWGTRGVASAAALTG